MEVAVEEVYRADHILIVGTSMQVYPAAGLVGYAPPNASIYYVDPNPSINYELQQRKGLEVLAEPATVGVRQLVDRFLL